MSADRRQEKIEKKCDAEIARCRKENVKCTTKTVKCTAECAQRRQKKYSVCDIFMSIRKHFFTKYTIIILKLIEDQTNF